MQSYIQVANYTNLFLIFLLYSMFLAIFSSLFDFFLKKNEERLCTRKKVPKFGNQNLTLKFVKQQYLKIQL